MRLAGGIACAAALAPVGPAAAQSYPSKPVTIVVPFPPGGATDVIARMFAQQLQESTKQPVIVSNVTGASGAIGHDQVARAAPDGYTLIIGTASTMAGTPAYMDTKWDPIRDFTPIALLSTESLAVLVHPSVPAQTVGELIVLAKSKPGGLSMASFGSGSISHLAGALFNTMAGTDMLHVPYQGSGPALNAMIGGHVQVMIHTLSVSLPPVQGGKLRMLAITEATRKPNLPDMPTVIESGLPGYTAQTWLGLFGPAKLPPDVTAFLTAEARKMLAKPEVRERLLAISSEPANGSPDELAIVLKRDLEKWRKTIKDANIKRGE
jgi:tripartite-type tricarboxylate transporter receptor subunit TctC